MKTRTLLLLSVGTALMILLAGGALLFQLSTQDEPAVPNGLGDEVRVGDVTAVLVDVEVREESTGEVLAATVRVGGVDDSDGLGSFGLLAAGEAIAPVDDSDDDGRCRAVTVAEQTCVLEFDLVKSPGTVALLVLTRGEERATWSLPTDR